MKISKSIQAGVVIAFTAVLAFFSIKIEYTETSFAESSIRNDFFSNGQEEVRLNLYYSDATEEDFLKKLTREYQDETGVRVTPVFVDDIDYLENISGLQGEDTADIILLKNSDLELASMFNMACEVDVKDDLAKTALRAATYKGKVIGIPYYYDTSFLVYNTDYLRSYAKDRIDAVRAQEAADEASGEAPEDVADASEEEINEMVATLIPGKLKDLEAVAEEYDAPLEVRAFFDWDEEDVFYNYFFIGSGLDIGGEYGDDDSILQAKNKGTVRGMKLFKELNEFFQVAEDESSYESVRNDLVNGALVYAICSTDVISDIERNNQNGYEFAAMKLPPIDDEVESMPLAVTGCICISPAGNVEKAREFADYMVGDKGTRIMYDSMGKLSPYNRYREYTSLSDVAYDAYLASVPMPKLVGKSDFWMQTEIAFTNVRGKMDPLIAIKGLDKALK